MRAVVSSLALTSLLSGCNCGTFTAHLERYDTDYRGVEQCGAHDGTFAELDLLGTTLQVNLAPKIRGADRQDEVDDVRAWFAIPVQTLESAAPGQNVFFAAEARYVNGDRELLGDPTGEVYVLDVLSEQTRMVDTVLGKEEVTFARYELAWDLVFGDPDGMFDWLTSVGEDRVEAALD
jgi:hypothetical protein